MLKLENLSKFYYNKGMITSGLTNINLELNCGDFVVITGESGSGKSTLLNVLAGLDSYEEGEMYVEGKETSYFTQTDLENYRKTYIGNIFQSFNLVNSYTVYKNIELGLLLNNYDKKTKKQEILKVIDQVGLTEFKNTKVAKLSGGQKQRVAIARVLVRKTPIILADEPTGNLDQTAAQEIYKLLSEIAKEKLMIVVSHEADLAKDYVSRKIVMSDGNILEEQIIKPATVVEHPEIEAPKQISLGDQIRLGIRNTFNLFVKFTLLLITFVVLTSGVLIQYASYRYQQIAETTYGYNRFFRDTSDKRIVVNKNDKSQFTEEELTKINALEGVDYFVKNDIILDLTANLENSETWIDGVITDVAQLKEELTYGRLPENDQEVVVTVQPWLIESQGEDGIRDKNYIMHIWELGDNIFNHQFTVTGIIVQEDYNNQHVYVDSSIFDFLSGKVNSGGSKLETKLNGQIYESSNNATWFGLYPSPRVAKGQVIVSGDMNGYCKKMKCKNRKINVKIDNLYYTETIDLKISKVVKTKKLKAYFDLGNNWRDYTTTFFVSQEDYDFLFNRPDYQISVFLKDVEALDATMDQLKAWGYNPLYVRAALQNDNGSVSVFINIGRTIVFAFSITALFFVCYFVIRLILNSRQSYYAIVRILGGSNKAIRNLILIELFTVGNLAFVTVCGSLIANRLGYLPLALFTTAVGYINVLDVVILYVIISLIIVWLALRISRTLFAKSAIQIYREGVQQ